jgi:hypothetical protein
VYLTMSRSCDPAIENAHHFALARLRVAHDRSEFHDLLTSHIKHIGVEGARKMIIWSRWSVGSECRRHKACGRHPGCGESVETGWRLVKHFAKLGTLPGIIAG